MRAIHWIERKQLDRVTNYSTETEIIRAGLNRNIPVFYYCSFAKRKEYYNLEGYIRYLGYFKNRFIKGIEFHSLVVLRAIIIVLKERYCVIMVNQDLIVHMLPALLINCIFSRQNKFIVDIRTTPVNPENFNKEMKYFHRQFKFAVRLFHGLSFITPFMEKFVMKKYNTEYKSVNWSSGVDIELFNPDKIEKCKEPSNKFQIFYHGGISLSRGNLLLIKACERLINIGYDIELIQVGILVNDSIREYIMNNNIERWCKVLPPVDLKKIPQLVANCDLPVLPFPYFMGWRVSSPIKLMEYLAMGKKVLAPKMESFTDVFGEESDLVFYFDPKNGFEVQNIYEAIKNILDGNLVEKNSYIIKARDLVANNYTWENQASNLFNFCKSQWIQ